MKQIIALCALLLLFSHATWAQSYSSTTDVLYIDYGATTITGTTQHALSYRVTATMGGSEFDLTDMAVYWMWYSIGDVLFASYPATVESATGGIVSATCVPSSAFTGYARMQAYSTLNGAPVGTLALDYVQVSDASSGSGCGDVYVTVNPTADVAVTTGPITVSAMSSVNVYIASGLASLAGATGTVFVTSTNSSVHITIQTNVDGTYNLDFCVFGDVAAHTPVPNIGSNKASFVFSGSTNYWQVPSGVTSVYALVWGGGGAGGVYGSAGFSAGRIPVNSLEYLSVVVGRGGQMCTGTLVSTDNAWPNGGRGVCTSSGGGNGACGGGGMSALFRETNVLLVAGGGGGGLPVSSSFGGGVVGGTPGLISVGFGQGGTLTNGGAAGGQGVFAPAITNSSGSFFSGGDAGMSTNIVVQYAGGGGGGLYGGGGSYSDSSHLQTAGGGGSGFVSPEVVGFTVSSRSIFSPGIDRPEYADINSPGASFLPGASGGRANSGYVVIYY